VQIAYFDCFSGAGGDMIVASLLDAGAPADVLRERLDALGLSGYRLTIDKVSKRGIAASRYLVELDESQKHPHRHLKHIFQILDAGRLPASVLDKSKRVFTRLAEAEAAVHNSTIEKVHFHEVGAIDAVLDIVGAVSALELLGVEEVHCSPVVVGSGTVMCDHGLLPVPPPAVAKLLEGVPVVPTTEDGELLTPTAAALLTTLSVRFGPPPPMTVRSVGYGAGMKDTKGLPNVLRVTIGEIETAPGPGSAEGLDTDSVTVLETNIDDATAQVVGHCLTQLMEAGALDAYTMPISMKKWRTGLLLTVLCQEGDVHRMQDIIFRETPTLGIRRHRAERIKLARRQETVETPYGPIAVKVGQRGTHSTATPEYDACRAAAVKHGVPLRSVIAAAEAAWNAR
jgi:uncharacterized protein (TIGR00299 family) protein